MTSSEPDTDRVRSGRPALLLLLLLPLLLACDRQGASGDCQEDRPRTRPLPLLY